MPNGPQKLVLINAGRYDYAEIELSGSLQIVGPNNTGKTTLINTLQFLYLDDRRHMDFGSYSTEQTREYYFPNQYSYILFECLGARGKLVIGWRGQSKAAGGEPEKFHYEGAYDSSDFLTENGEVREPKAINSKLSGRNYALLKGAQEHRELLLQTTRGDSRGMGLVVLHDNDKYPQFRETLKNLLCLSTISQDQMRDRLLMLAGLPTEKYALDIRELFGDDYDRILRLKGKLMRFKKHQPQIEMLVDTCARQEATRGELIYRWSDLRAKRQAFERKYLSELEKFDEDIQRASETITSQQAIVALRRNDQNKNAISLGALEQQLQRIAALALEFRDFAEDLVRITLKNIEAGISRLERQLADAEKQTREKTEAKIKDFHAVVVQKRQTIAIFDRALVTVLRRNLDEREIAMLARLFNFGLLEQPVGNDGIQLHKQDEFIGLLHALARRIKGGIYRDELVEMPLPEGRQSLAHLANLDTVREQLAEAEEALKNWEDILKAIAEKEDLALRLNRQRVEGNTLRNTLFRWEQFQEAKADEARLKAELKQTNEVEGVIAKHIVELEDQIEAARAAKMRAENGKKAKENAFAEVMNRFRECVFPEFGVKPTTPEETIPDDFDPAVSLFLRQQKKLAGLDQETRDGFHDIGSALGGDFAGADETETIRRLREELEAMPEQEDALRRDWDHHLHQLRATFDQVLRSLDDIKSAADRLNRALSGIQVSNLKALRMEVVEQIDLVGSLRKLANIEQPGLFDDGLGLEVALTGFRQKFENNPLLRYADMFTLRFTVTGDDGKPHHYNDFKQVESHGTTITIKVLFNLLVLRSLLREDAGKALLCEIPFFLDEIHSLHPTNRHTVLATARKLGFIAITAAPESVSEVDALYFLQPNQGRIVLRHRHRVIIKPRTLRT